MARGRPSRFEVMTRNKDLITAYISSLQMNIFTYEKMNHILIDLKGKGVILQSTKLADFLVFIVKEKIMLGLDIELPQRSTTRYIFGKPSVFEIALTLNKKSYISHFSAVYLHHLTDNIPKKIYINAEQSRKQYSPQFRNEDVEQRNIDLAFSRPMRETNQIAKFTLSDEDFELYMLNGKNHNRLGVIQLDIDGTELPVTSIERTLIDIVVRPNYAGGVSEVLNVFSAAKNRFSVNKLLATLKKMEYIYPYHQLIGFYLEKAGYPETVLKLLKQFPLNYDFYLTYQMREKNFSERWRVYYPKWID